MSVNDRVHEMRRLQTYRRIVNAADAYYVESNNEYVMTYSIIQTCVIVLSSIVQTYFIKRLFQTPTVSAEKFKPKA